MELYKSEVIDQKVRSTEGVPSLVDKLDINKSLGPDGIHPRVLKELKGEIVKLLAKCVNCCCKQSPCQRTGRMLMWFPSISRTLEKTLDTRYRSARLGFQARKMGRIIKKSIPLNIFVYLAYWGKICIIFIKENHTHMDSLGFWGIKW